MFDRQQIMGQMGQPGFSAANALSSFQRNPQMGRPIPAQAMPNLQGMQTMSPVPMGAQSLGGMPPMQNALAGFDHGNMGGPNADWQQAKFDWRQQRPDFRSMFQQMQGTDPGAWRAQLPEWRQQMQDWRGMRPDRQTFFQGG